MAEPLSLDFGMGPVDLNQYLAAIKQSEQATTEPEPVVDSKNLLLIAPVKPGIRNEVVDLPRAKPAPPAPVTPRRRYTQPETEVGDNAVFEEYGLGTVPIIAVSKDGQPEAEPTPDTGVLKGIARAAVVGGVKVRKTSNKLIHHAVGAQVGMLFGTKSTTEAVPNDADVEVTEIVHNKGEDMANRSQTEQAVSAPQVVQERYEDEDPNLLMGAVPADEIGELEFDRLANGKFLIPNLRYLAQPAEPELPEVPELPGWKNPIQRLFVVPPLIEEKNAERDQLLAKHESEKARIAQENQNRDRRNEIARAKNERVKEDAEYVGEKLTNYLEVIPDVTQGVTSEVLAVLPPQSTRAVKETMVAHAVLAGTGIFRQAAKSVLSNHGGIFDDVPPAHEGMSLHHAVPNLVIHAENEQLEAERIRAVNGGLESVALNTDKIYQVTLDALSAIGLGKECDYKGRIMVDGWALTQAAVDANAVKTGQIEISYVSPDELSSSTHSTNGDKAKAIENRQAALEQIRLQSLAATILASQYLPHEITKGLGSGLDADPDNVSAVERGSNFAILMAIRSEGRDFLLGGEPGLQVTTGKMDADGNPAVDFLMEAQAVELNTDVTVPVLESLRGQGTFVNPLQPRGVGTQTGDRRETVYSPIDSIRWQTNTTRNGRRGDDIGPDYAPDGPQFKVVKSELGPGSESGRRAVSA